MTPSPDELAKAVERLLGAVRSTRDGIDYDVGLSSVAADEIVRASLEEFAIVAYVRMTDLETVLSALGRVTEREAALARALEDIRTGVSGFYTATTTNALGRDQNRALKFNLLERIDAALAEQPASAGPNRTMGDEDRERVDAFHTAYESAVEATANDLLSMAASDGLDYPAALGVAADLIEALVAWNDAHWRTQAEVVAALRAAAEANRQPQEKGE